VTEVVPGMQGLLRAKELALKSLEGRVVMEIWALTKYLASNF